MPSAFHRHYIHSAFNRHISTGTIEGPTTTAVYSVRKIYEVCISQTDRSPWREDQKALAADGLLEYLRLSRVRKGGPAAQQLVQEAAQGPVVYGLVVAARQHQLGREVVGRPAEGERLGLHRVVLLERDALGEPEVDHLSEWNRIGLDRAVVGAG